MRIRQQNSRELMAIMKYLMGKELKASRLLSAGSVALLVFGALGCRSTGYVKSDAAGRSLQMAAWEVQAQNRWLDLTMQSLKDLVEKPAPDLRPQFERFNDCLDRLTYATKRNEKAST